MFDLFQFVADCREAMVSDKSQKYLREVVARAVRRAAEKGVDLAQLGVDELKQFSNLIGADVIDKLSLEGSLAARDHIGGTAPKQVRAAIARARRRLTGR